VRASIVNTHADVLDVDGNACQSRAARAARPYIFRLPPSRLQLSLLPYLMHRRVSPVSTAPSVGECRLQEHDLFLVNSEWCIVSLSSSRQFSQDQAHVRPSHDLARVPASLDSVRLAHLYSPFLLHQPDNLAEMLHDLAGLFEPFKSMMMPRSPLTDTELTPGWEPPSTRRRSRSMVVRRASLPVRLVAVEADAHLGLLASAGFSSSCELEQQT
jgi:hypothetical protein